MRITPVAFLNLLVFCKLASALDEASPDQSKCATWGVTYDSSAELSPLGAMSLKTQQFPDVPWFNDGSGLMRLNPGLSLYTNDVHCWPSVGGFIIAENVHPVELDYIGLDRFHITPRSVHATEEDAFCMKLACIGTSLVILVRESKMCASSVVVGKADESLLSRVVQRPPTSVI